MEAQSKKLRIIGIRGLVRGNIHWADFSIYLKQIDSELEFETVEIPGNGNLTHEVTPINAEILISELRKQSQFLKSREKVNLIGISLGGMLALKWAELYPDEIDRLVVVNSSLASLSRHFERLHFKNYLKVISILLNQDPTTREKEILDLTANNQKRKDHFFGLFANQVKAHPVSAHNFFRQLKLANSISIKNAYPNKTLVLNSLGDTLVNPKCSLDISQAFGLELKSHNSAGHDLILDDPQWLANQAVEFFRRSN